MKSLSKYIKTHSYCQNKGMTLIEVILYSMLLSMLLAGFIKYVYDIHSNEIKLDLDIKDAQFR
ncbi:MAG: hypothetical protein WCW03_00550 [Candidatus Paceibacterota bacterium]